MRGGRGTRAHARRRDHRRRALRADVPDGERPRGAHRRPRAQVLRRLPTHRGSIAPIPTLPLVDAGAGGRGGTHHQHQRAVRRRHAMGIVRGELPRHGRVVAPAQVSPPGSRGGCVIRAGSGAVGDARVRRGRRRRARGS